MGKTTNQELGAGKSKYIADGVSNVSLNYIESGKGAILKDVEGNEFIDFACGIGVMNIGGMKSNRIELCRHVPVVEEHPVYRFVARTVGCIVRGL